MAIGLGGIEVSYSDMGGPIQKKADGADNKPKRGKAATVAASPSTDDPNAVTWDKVIGLEDAKTALREAIELPQQHSALYAAYGKRPTKGVLLYGPPGCGKTMLAKAVATSLRAGRPVVRDSTAGNQPTHAFQYVKGPEVIDMYVGQSEENVRSLFARARQHHKLAKYPGTIFIDEADTLFQNRGKGRDSFMAGVTNTFLAEMDGLDETGPLVLLSTNRPDSLDVAVVRDGRIDHKVRVGRPSQEAVADIAKSNLKGVPKAPKSGDLAAQLTEQLFSTDHERDPLLRIHIKGMTGHIQVYLRDLVNGAMVVGIVEKAKAAAIRRDIASKRKKARGIESADITQAILASETSLRGLNNMYVVEELVDDLTQVANVERIK